MCDCDDDDKTSKGSKKEDSESRRLRENSCTSRWSWFSSGSVSRDRRRAGSHRGPSRYHRYCATPQPEDSPVRRRGRQGGNWYDIFGSRPGQGGSASWTQIAAGSAFLLGMLLFMFNSGCKWYKSYGRDGSKTFLKRILQYFCASGAAAAGGSGACNYNAGATSVPTPSKYSIGKRNCTCE